MLFFIIEPTCHILPPSEIDWGLLWAASAGSEGKYLFHRIGRKGRIWQLGSIINNNIAWSTEPSWYNTVHHTIRHDTVSYKPQYMHTHVGRGSLAASRSRSARARSNSFYIISSYFHQIATLFHTLTAISPEHRIAAPKQRVRSVLIISNRKISNWASQILKANTLLMCPYCLKFQIARV